MRAFLRWLFGWDRPLFPDIRRLELKPGDILVLETEQALSAAAADRMRRAWAEANPAPGVRMIILDGGTKCRLITPVRP